jgi:hypothetical protein
MDGIHATKGSRMTNHLCPQKKGYTIMDKTGQISENNINLSRLAVDGLIYGLLSGVAMYLSLAAFALLSGESPVVVASHFSIGEQTSPWLGLFGHLAVSAIYGALFGALIWPVLRRISDRKMVTWLGGLAYAALLLILAQFAILPNTNSPLDILSYWQWVIVHGVYGLVLGGLYSRI